MCPLSRGKAVERVGTAPMETFRPAGHRRGSNEAVSPPHADGSAVASLPRVPDEESVKGKIPLVQVGIHLRSMHVKKQANRQH